jgi:hypothetical protein
LIRFGLNIGKAWSLCPKLLQVPTQNQKTLGRRVRSCSRFRLKTRKPWLQSPKLHRVPTKNQKNQVAESEVAPGSDSEPEKPGRRVRSCTGFRLKTRKTRSQSPKLYRVPTQNQKNLVAESEVAPGSDSKLEKPGRRVRSCTGFRLKTRKTWLQSLKLLQVPTQN